MARRSRKNIGLIGLGIIGSRVAARLRAAGYKVYVWSRTPRAEPNFLGSPAKVAEVCEIIQIFVSDAEAVYETVERLSAGLTPEHVVVCNSTIGPAAVREAARRVQALGAQFVDAPFTGSRAAAETSQLVYYAGGEDAVLDRVEPVLLSTGKTMVRIGGVGDASIVKVALNMMVAVSTQTLAEALAVVRESGVAPQKFADALLHNSARSPVTDLKVPKMLQRDYDPHFSLKNMFKDVQLAVHMANGLDLDIPATTATAGVMYGALNRGWGDQDFSVVSETFPQPEIVEPEPEAAQAIEEPPEQPLEPPEETPELVDGKAEVTDEKSAPVSEGIPAPEEQGPAPKAEPEPPEEKTAPVSSKPAAPPVTVKFPRISTKPEQKPAEVKEAKPEAPAALEEPGAVVEQQPEPVSKNEAGDPSFPPPPAPEDRETAPPEPASEVGKQSEGKPAPPTPRRGGILNALFGPRP